MQRYFDLSNDFNNIILSEDDIFHIKQVMRMRIDDNFEVVKNNKVYLCKIISLNPFKFSYTIDANNNNELKVNITLIYAFPKFEKLEFAIQKAVELGVKQIVLVNSEHVVFKLDEEKNKNKFVRFNKIIKEAAEQSKRNYLPKLTLVKKFEDILSFKSELNLFAYEKSDTSLTKLHEILSNKYIKNISILIGPEGGFTKEEANYAIQNGFNSISLGKRILRSETSVIYLLSLLGYEYEE